MKVTVIGSGNMGGALIRGWHKAGGIEITATAHTQTTLDKVAADCPGIKVTTDNAFAVKDADIVVLAVKPWLVEQVIKEILPILRLDTQTIVSVAANVGTQQLREMLGSDSAKVVYAMPNIAAEYGESMTFMTCDSAKTLFEKVGKVQVVEERLMGAGMMMAGCGIAYVMRYLRAMQEGGVEMGFYPHVAQEIAMQTMQGAVTLLKETGLHPETAIDKVTTPGGITIKGLNELDHAGFNSAVIRSLKAGLK